MSSPGQKSALIIHPGGLGDVLLSLPAISAIRRNSPACEIVLLAGSEIGQLLRECGIVERSLSIESGVLASLFGGVELSPPLQRQMTDCDCVVGWLADADGALRTTFQQSGIDRIVLGSPVPQRGVHQSKRFLDVLGAQRGNHSGPVHVVVPDTLKQPGVELLRGIGLSRDQAFVMCHPGSGSCHKCVRPEVMAEVIRNFQQHGAQPVLIAGPADQEAVECVRGFGLQAIPVIRRQSLRTITGILAQARLFVGHDSGLTHLAAALQIPTVAIFGPTDSRQWAPLGDHVSVVTGPPCSCLSWDQVRACERKPCLAIAAGQILEVSFSILSRYRSVTIS